MTKQSPIDRVWNVVDKVGVCMMTTRFSDGLRARPLEARADRNENVIWFLSDRRASKDDEIKAYPTICLTFIDPKEKVYLSISGNASMSRDTESAKRLWNSEQVISFRPERAEIWDGPASSALAGYEFAKARATGQKPNLGEKRKSTVRMD